MQHIYLFTLLFFFLLSGLCSAQMPGHVFISEFSASNKKIVLDEDGESSDWIELFNPTKQTINLHNWALSDDSLNLTKWEFPNVELEAGAFLVVFASQKDRKTPGGELHTNFRLESDGEYLALFNASGEFMTEFKPKFEQQYQDISYGVEFLKDTITLVHDSTVGKLLLPDASQWNDLGQSWTGKASDEPFNTNAWTDVYATFGFDERIIKGTDNLALNKPSQQSSGYSGDQFPASNATDGNTNNFTHTGDGDLSPWWEVDLEESFLIDKVVLHNRKNCCHERLYNIVIEILDEAGNTVFQSPTLNAFSEGQTPQSPGDRLEYDLDIEPLNAVYGQKVRVKKESISGVREYLSLAEVEVFGIESNYQKDIRSDISEMKDAHSVALARFNFEIENSAAIDYSVLNMKFDDGFIAYINGVEFARANAPQHELEHLSTASATHLAVEKEEFTVPSSILKDGNNVLAIVGLNLSKEDESFLMNPNLLAFKLDTAGLAYFPQPSPGKLNKQGIAGFVADTKFNIDRGFFEEAFTLLITSKTPGATIVYTTDGSEPTLGNGTVVPPLNENAVCIASVDISETTIIRAAAFKDELKSTNTDTHSYIFLDDVISSTVMDEAITNDVRYKNHMKQALSDIPSLSLVIPPGTIEDEVDRKASLEWIENGTEEGFQVNCGARYYGGEWAGPFAKQNFRIYFRGRYGTTKLKYPLFDGFDFGIPAENKFDQLEIRAGSHDMVQRGFYMSNRFCDDTMLEMGNLNSHGRFVHLYFNGVYWGMYHLRERFNADWLSQYAGGNKDDYEAISGNKNIGGWTLQDRVYDGAGTAWEKAKEYRSQYDSIKEYVDLQSYIDFMLMYMFGNSENEYRAVGSTEPGVGFQFQMNDADGFLRDSGNRTNMGQPGQQHADGPGSIFSMLLKEGHPAYKMLLADRIHKHFFNEGALTPEKISDRLGKRCNEVAIPFYAEAARWGYRSPDSWESAKNAYFENVIPYRTETVIQQFKNAGFYPDLEAPTYFVNNEEKFGGYFNPGDVLTLFKNDGEAYYTLDGSDPYNPVQSKLEADTLIHPGAQLKVYVPNEELNVNWNKLDFNDGNWTSGNGAVGYEKGQGYEAEINLNVEQMFEKSSSCLIRIPFTADSLTLSKANKLLLEMKYDDGFIAYLNGNELKRVNYSGQANWNSVATEASEANAFKVFDVSQHMDKLVEGANVLAIHGMNNSTSSSDFFMSSRLIVQSDLALEEQLTAKALKYENTSFVLDTSFVISARTYKDGIWSALSRAEFISDINTDINTIDDFMSEMKCFPNPFNKAFFIEFVTTHSQPVRLEVYNATGTLVYSTEQHSLAREFVRLKVDTQNWGKGIYMYRITDGVGNNKTGKIIKAF